MNKNISQFLYPFLWIGITFVYYIVYKIRLIHVDKRFLVYAVDMIYILCLMPHRLDWMVPYCLLLLMISHWTHWFARQQVEPLDVKYTPFNSLIVLVVLDGLLILSYRCMLDDGSLKDRLTIEQSLLMVHAVHTTRIWSACKALKVECLYCDQLIPETMIFFEGFQLVGTIFILFYYWPAVGLGNVLYRLQCFYTVLDLIGSRKDARSAIEKKCKKLHYSEIMDLFCIICRESMEPTEQCGWVRLPCGHSYHRCCAMARFNGQFLCPLCGVKIQA
ncbi:E3 ubiquitin-protein ligase hrd-1-like isoform X1 [Drosophila pseudoobscura]|uniref:E3 ubiquitin-protein ligase hrd-1-like isoform X1 n=2 Tax=Drosophila pseudoobscura pseudoobscura TaxID=46245 RepID=A0A6I8VI15_DROPS|nr:E3 ubiquitin-protein ligase hrd-1 isoform X1 [Drosophila pseudoobscura]